MKPILTILLLLLIMSDSFGQMESNFWYFGANGGMNFTGGAPVPAVGGAINTSEGSSAVSDPTTGAVLFYSDGSVAYNSANVAMPNGTGLMGGPSSTQPALIVPCPGSTTLYYLFTTDQMESSGANGIRYSVIDMTLDGGLGDVTATKNVLLYAPAGEQLCATKHANCVDWWIMTKELDNNVFKCFLLTASGVTGPVVSTIGLPITGFSAGQAKFTPDGTHYAIGTANGSVAELFDFDNTTGMLSDAITLVATASDNPYGLSFSGDNTKLYMLQGASANELFQYDITSGVAATILATKTFIGTTASWGQLQLGSDFKLYVAGNSGSTFLSVVNSPNLPGAACGWSSLSVAIGGSQSPGLCNFPDSYFNETTPCLLGLNANANNSAISCNGSADANAWVTASSGLAPYSYVWSPGGSTNDTIFNLGPGTYVVTVTDAAGTTTIDSVIITQPNVLTVAVNPANDTVCAGTPLTFTSTVNGGTTAYSYQWNTNANDTLATNSELLSSSGYVGLAVTDANGCTAIDSVYITVLPIPQVISSNDTNICNGSSVTLTASGTPAFTWSTGATTSSITVSPTSSTLYIVSYTNGTCTTYDSTFVTVHNNPGVTINAIDSVCEGTLVTFTAVVAGGVSPFTYSWSGSASGSTASVSATPPGSGTVNVTVTDNFGCVGSASTPITVLPIPIVTASTDTCICSGSSITLTATGTPGYLWNTGETTASITVSPLVLTTYIVSYSNGVCSTSDSVIVCVNPVPVVIASNDTSIEYGSSVFLLATGTGPFEWSPAGSLSCSDCANPEATPTTSGTYIVTTTNAFGCSASDQVVVDIFYVLIIPNIFTPNGDGLNDVFNILGLPPESKISIFNRWGNELYTTESYMNNWTTGTDGVYYYVLHTPDGKDFSGFFHVTGNK